MRDGACRDGALQRAVRLPQRMRNQPPVLKQDGLATAKAAAARQRLGPCRQRLGPRRQRPGLRALARIAVAWARLTEARLCCVGSSSPAKMRAACSACRPAWQPARLLRVPQRWGLGFHLTLFDLPGMRSLGTAEWAGVFKSCG